MSKKFVVYYEEDIVLENGKMNLNILAECKASDKEIVLCSHKTISYIIGMLSAIDMEKLYIVAESGAFIQYGIEMPPKKHYVFSCEEAEIVQMEEIKNDLKCTFSEIWFQDNTIGINGFVTEDSSVQLLDEKIRGYKSKYPGLNICRKEKQIAIMPMTISFEEALKYIERDMLENEL